jgi:hypothetical protein
LISNPFAVGAFDSAVPLRGFSYHRFACPGSLRFLLAV